MHRTRAATLAVFCGAVFASSGVTAEAGTFKLLYNFQGGGGDGADPQAALTAAGTACYGGSAGAGVVFAVTP